MLITSYYAVMSDEITYRVGLLLATYYLSVKEIYTALDLEQPHVSHKLAKLRKHSYVRSWREGKRVFYRLNEPWRHLLLHGDINWRKLNPEMTSLWREDFTRLEDLVSEATLEDRIVHPVISGPPRMPAEHPG